MRRVNWTFAAILFFTFAASAGAFHALHIVRYGQIADDFRWQVDRARDDGRTDDAIKFAGQYLDFRPADVDMMADLAGWLRDKAKTRKQQNSVLNLYVRILRYSPDDAAIRLKAAELAMSLRDWAAALENLDVLLKSRPDDAELCEDYGYCLQEIGKYEESSSWYKRSVRADPKRATAYVGLAAVLFQGLKQPVKALACVEEACRVNPDSGFAQAARAEHLRLNGRLKDAADAVAIAQKHPSKDKVEQQRIIEIVADIEQSAGHYDNARKLLGEGAHDFPENTRFVCNLACQHLFDGRADLAIATLRESRDKSARDKIPPDANVLTLLADILARDGQVAPLEDALHELTEMNAPPDLVQYVQARLLLRRGRWAEAASLLNRIRMVSLRTPNLYRQTNLLLAQCCEQLGDTAGELDAYRKLLENDPNAGAIRLDYARSLARHGQQDEAVTQFLSVVPQAQVNSRAVAECTRTLCDLVRNDPKTWSRLEKAIDALKPENGEVNPALARAYLDLARFRAADSVAPIEKLVHAKPRNPALHVARVELARQVFGLDRALQALTDAEAAVGDLPELRIIRIKLLAARLDPSCADGIAALARGVDRFTAEDRERILREVIAAYRTLDDGAAINLHLDLLAQLRPDLITAREAQFARALKIGDEVRCRAILRDVESIEGPDGPTAHLLDPEQQLWLGDPAALAKATEQLAAAARGRPADPIIEFLRGRVDEIAGRKTDALQHYRAAFAAGLADRPVEDLFSILPGKSGTAPIVILRDQLPLADWLRPDRHQSLIAVVMPLFDPAGQAALSGRLASATNPADAATLTWLGRLFARCQQSGQAEQCFQLAVTGAPQSPEGWLALVAYQAGRGNDLAMNAAANRLRETMAPIEAHLVVGRAFESVHRLDAAQKEYENAAALKPNDTRPLKSLANLATSRGRTDEALRRLEQLVALPAPTSDEDQAWARRTLAVQLAMSPAAGSLDRALTLLDQNKVNDQAADDDQRARVLVLAAQKSRPMPGATTARREAIRILEDLRKRGTARSADDLILLANLYRADGDEAGARRAREQMASEYPTHFGCTVFLAKEALLNHDLPACERLLPALRRLGAGQFESLAIEFQYRVLAGTPEPGRRSLEEYVAAVPPGETRSARAVRCANLIFDFLQSHPTEAHAAIVSELRAAACRLYGAEALTNRDAFQRLVTLLAVQPGATDSALSLVQKGQKAFGPELAAAAYVQLLRYGSMTKPQVSDLEKFLRNEMNKAPQSTSLLLTWAEYLQLTGANAEAVKIYREVIRREPDNVLALNNLAWTLSLDRRDEGKVRESLVHIQRAIELAGPLDELLDTRARILFESGKRDAALQDMWEAVNEAPSAARLTDYALMLQKAGKPQEAERALAAARRFGLGNR